MRHVHTTASAGATPAFHAALDAAASEASLIAIREATAAATSDGSLHSPPHPAPQQLVATWQCLYVDSSTPTPWPLVRKLVSVMAAGRDWVGTDVMLSPGFLESVGVTAAPSPIPFRSEVTFLRGVVLGRWRGNPRAAAQEFAHGFHQVFSSPLRPPWTAPKLEALLLALLWEACDIVAVSAALEFLDTLEALVSSLSGPACRRCIALARCGVSIRMLRVPADLQSCAVLATVSDAHDEVAVAMGCVLHDAIFNRATEAERGTIVGTLNEVVEQAWTSLVEDDVVQGLHRIATALVQCTLLHAQTTLGHTWLSLAMEHRRHALGLWLCVLDHRCLASTTDANQRAVIERLLYVDGPLQHRAVRAVATPVATCSEHRSVPVLHAVTAQRRQACLSVLDALWRCATTTCEAPSQPSSPVTVSAALAAAVCLLVGHNFGGTLASLADCSGGIDVDARRNATFMLLRCAALVGDGAPQLEFDVLSAIGRRAELLLHSPTPQQRHVLLRSLATTTLSIRGAHGDGDGARAACGLLQHVGSALEQSTSCVGWCAAVLRCCDPTLVLPAFERLLSAFPSALTPKALAVVTSTLRQRQMVDAIVDAWNAFERAMAAAHPALATVAQQQEALLVNALPARIDAASLRRLRSEGRSAMEAAALDVLLTHVCAGGLRREAVVSCLFRVDARQSGDDWRRRTLQRCAKGWLPPSTTIALQLLLSGLLGLHSNVAPPKRFWANDAARAVSATDVVSKMHMLEALCSPHLDGLAQKLEPYAASAPQCRQEGGAEAGQRTGTLLSMFSKGQHASTMRHIPTAPDLQHQTGAAAATVRPQRTDLPTVQKSEWYRLADRGEWLRALETFHQAIVLPRRGGPEQLHTATVHPRHVYVLRTAISICRAAAKSGGVGSWIGALSALLDCPDAVRDPLAIGQVASLVASEGAWQASLALLGHVKDQADSFVLGRVLSCLCATRQQCMIPTAWSTWRASVGDKAVVSDRVLETVAWGCARGSMADAELACAILVEGLAVPTTASSPLASSASLVVLLRHRWVLSAEAALQVALHSGNAAAVDAVLGWMPICGTVQRKVLQYYLLRREEVPLTTKQLLLEGSFDPAKPLP